MQPPPNGMLTGPHSPTDLDAMRFPILGADGKPYRDGYAIPTPITFAGIVNSTTRTYSSRWDEAVLASRDNARSMWRDSAIQAMLQERWAPTIALSWHLEPEDKKSKVQKVIADEMTKIVNRIPHKMKLKQSLLKGGWYGRAGANLLWGEKEISGQKRKMVVGHVPINGDKIQYDFDGNPAILVHSGYVTDLEKRHATIIRTDRGNALSLRDPYWRQQVAIYVHEQDDADFMEPELAGAAIGGLGIRGRIYWFWWMRTEFMSWISDFYERVGQGVYVYYFESGNPQSEAAARNAAENQSRRNVILWPVLNGQKQPPPIEFISPNVTGAEHLLSIVTDYWDKSQERYIVGQTASSRSDTSGMGTHDTTAQENTKYRLIKMDAENVDEAMTEDVIAPIMARNFPTEKWYLRHVSEVDQPDSDKKLTGAKTLFDMKIPLNEDEVRGVAGFSKPEPGEEIIKEDPIPPPGMGPMGGGQPGNPGQPPNGPQGPQNGDGKPKPMPPEKFKQEQPPFAGSSPRRMARFHERQVERYMEHAHQHCWRAVLEEAGDVPISQVAGSPVHQEFQQARYLSPVELERWAQSKVASANEGEIAQHYRRVSNAAKRAAEHHQEAQKVRQMMAQEQAAKNAPSPMTERNSLEQTPGIDRSTVPGRTTPEDMKPHGVQPVAPNPIPYEPDTGREFAESIAKDWNEREAKGGGVTQADLIDVGARLMGTGWRVYYKDGWKAIPYDQWDQDPLRNAKKDRVGKTTAEKLAADFNETPPTPDDLIAAGKLLMATGWRLVIFHDQWVAMPFEEWLKDPKRAAKEGAVDRLGKEPLPEGGHWVTIGAVNGHGGSPVYIKDGVVVVGHSSLKGKPVPTQVGKSSEEGRSRAKEAGVDPEHANQLASQMLAHDRAFKASHKAMLAEARKMSTALGHEDLTGLQRRSQQGNLDPSKIKGFDDLAARMAENYPEHFPNKDTAAEELYAMLTEGKRRDMTMEEAYQAAIDHLQSQNPQEDFPFGANASISDSISRITDENIRKTSVGIPFNKLYDQLKEEHPDLTAEQFKEEIQKKVKSGEYRLSKWPGMAEDVPNKDLAISRDAGDGFKDQFYYLQPK